MRNAIWAAAVVAAACVASVVGQQRDAEPNRRLGPDPGAPGPGMGSRLEMFLMRPGRVVQRDTWRVGRVECKPWDETAPGDEGTVRVNAVIAYVQDRPEERAAGVELVVQGEFQENTFVFDTDQVRDLLVGLESVRAASEKMREPPADVGRRVVYNLNGLEIGRSPRRTGGYLAPLGPDEPSIGLNPDNFEELRRILDDAQQVLKREEAR